MYPNKNSVLPFILPLILCCVVVLLSDARGAMAAEPVSVRRFSVSGDTVRLGLAVNAPAPQSLILELRLPPGTQVLATFPAARQANSRSGVVKWLFKAVAPGSIEVIMRVSPAAAARNVSGTLLYRMPGGGITTLSIAN